MDAEKPIRLLAIQANGENGGLYLAFIPEQLTEPEIKTALAELNIEPLATLEVGGWRTTERHVTIAFIPFPEPKLWSIVRSPSRS
jgi:hypothetical protein